jgi:hypothetical protein
LRNLSTAEARLVWYLIDGDPRYSYLTDQILRAEVEPLDDGGMGGLRFGTGAECRRSDRSISMYEFTDTDGVPVIASVLVDSDGNLFELDMWKGDNSPLRQFPNPTSS